MNRTFSLLLLSAAVASAEHYDASVFGALEWRSVGPLRGGRSITSAGSSSRPNEYYFGAVGGGLGICSSLANRANNFLLDKFPNMRYIIIYIKCLEDIVLCYLYFASNSLDSA